MTVFRWNKETEKIEAKQDEHPAYVVFHGQLPKGPHDNGKYRRPSPQAHRDSTDRTSTGPGGTFIWSTTHNPSTFNLSPGAVNYARGGGKGLTLVNYWPDPKPPTIPYAARKHTLGES